MTMTVEAVPGQKLYRAVVDALRREVESGRFAEAQLLPAERVLCELLDVSRTTLRKAIADLVDEGVLLHRHGAYSLWDFAAAGPYAQARVFERFSELGYRGRNAVILSFATTHGRKKSRHLESRAPALIASMVTEAEGLFVKAACARICRAASTRPSAS